MIEQEKLGELKELLSYWVSFFPLKNDQDEAKAQHKILIEMAKNQPELLISDETESGRQNLRAILEAFAWLCNNFEYVDEGDHQAMKELLVGWSQNEKVKALIESLNLDQKVQDGLREIMSQ